MMAFFNGTKRSKLVTAFVLILTLVISYAIPMTVYATPPPQQDETKIFKANLFDYDQNTVNAASMALGDTSSKNILAFFGSGTDSFNNQSNRGPHSICHDIVTRGIADPTLSGGTVTYADPIQAIDLFDVSSTNYVSYPNVNFPLYFDGDYYYYDSDDKSATYQNVSGGSLVLGKENDGFWPFGKKVFHFGLNMAFDFYMTSDRKVNGNDMEFTFSGDDDVWVFVDDKLVLDLGGIHGKESGSINFESGKIDYDGVSDKYLVNIFGDGWKTDEFAPNTCHTLKVFYLERGAGDSNFSMEFNLPQALAVEKEVAPTESGFTPITEEDFDFVIETLQKCDGRTAYKPFKDKAYTVFDSEGKLVEQRETDEDGVFSLKDGEKAIFTSLYNKTSFRIHEICPNGYVDETWKLPEPNNQNLAVSDGYVTGVFRYGSVSGDYSLLCENNPCSTDVTFEKRDKVTERAVSGASFELVGLVGVVGRATASSDSNGTVTFPDVPMGTYELREIARPLGYLLDSKTYYVTVQSMAPAVVRSDDMKVFCHEGGDGDDDCPPTECLLGYSIHYVENDERINASTIWNEPKILDLTVEKLVQGSHAPVDNEENGTTYYDFTIFYHDGYFIDDPWNVASTGAIFNGPITGVSLDQVDSNSGFGFSLPAGGSITIPIQEGVHYEVYENVPSDAEFDTYFMQTGNVAEELKGTGIESQMLEESVLTVLNQYGNDGLTVLKLVHGNQAPEEGTFDFVAKFWTPEEEDVMEENLDIEVGTRLDKAQADRDAAYASMSALDWTSLGAVQQAITDAGVSVAAASAALELANDGYDDAVADLDEANTSAGAIQDEIDVATDPAVIADLEDQITALGIDSLEDAAEAAEDAAEMAQDAYDDALADQADALQDFEDLKTLNPTIGAYLDAEDDLADAQAAYDDAAANQEKNIFERIWDRIVGFFRSLVVGDEYEMGVTDIVYSGTPAAFSYDSTTSQCAFTLDIAGSITFNFDEYFAANPNADKIFFEINEVGDGGAASVSIAAIDDPLPDSAYEENPTVTNNTIKGYVDRATEDPTIVYTNDFGDIFWKEYTVYHQSNTGTVFTSYSAMGIEGEELNLEPLDPEDIPGYSYTSVSAVGMTINPDDGGNIDDVLPPHIQNAIVITYVYTPDPTDDDDDTDREKHRGSTATTIVEEPTPAAPVTPEAVSTPVTSVIEEAIPAAPLPKTGGVAPYLLYGLGLLLAGGGVALKARNKKDKDE